MHAAHFLTRAALRYPGRPAWLQGDVTITFREASHAPALNISTATIGTGC